jgi:4-alpha-glucanotransferase
MARHGVHRMYVLQYELRPETRAPLGRVPEESQASLNTHDMPTFAAMWEALDTKDRLDLGLIDERGAEEDREERERLRNALTAYLREAGWLEAGAVVSGHEVMRACQRYLAASPSRTMIVNLEDLWDERRPQNIPGTGEERPNWVRKGAKALEEVRADPEVLGTFGEIDHLRKASPWAEP